MFDVFIQFVYLFTFYNFYKLFNFKSLKPFKRYFLRFPDRYIKFYKLNEGFVLFHLVSTIKYSSSLSLLVILRPLCRTNIGM